MTDHARVRPEHPELIPAINWRPYIMLAIGVLAVSTAAIFIRLAQGESAPSLVIAATRLCVATSVLTPIVIRRHWAEVRLVSVGDLKWTLLSGIVLGLHFATWISSLEYTAVVNSVTLVTATPLWVAIMAPLFLNERLRRGIIIGLIFAFGGGILVALSGEAGDPPTRHAPLLGNSLALTGALMAAIYMIIGRQLRARLSVVVYIWLVYGVAAITMLVAAGISGEQVLGLPSKAYLWMLLMGLVPQLIGHSSINYVLGYFPAAYVSLVTLVEPVISSLLAIIFLNEWPVLVQLVGATLILVGIGVASKEQKIQNVTETG